MCGCLLLSLSGKNKLCGYLFHSIISKSRLIQLHTTFNFYPSSELNLPAEGKVEYFDSSMPVSTWNFPKLTFLEGRCFSTNIDLQCGNDLRGIFLLACVPFKLPQSTNSSTFSFCIYWFLSHTEISNFLWSFPPSYYQLPDQTYPSSCQIRTHILYPLQCFPQGKHSLLTKENTSWLQCCVAVKTHS